MSMSAAHRYEVVEASREHVVPIAMRLRQSDINEIWAASALLPVPGMLASLEGSTVARTWLIDGIPVAMGGIKPWPDDPNRGLIWFLASTEIMRHKWRFIVESRAEFIERRQAFAYLHNWVDERDRQAVRWLKWLGFHVEPPAPHGVFGKRFHYFWREN